MSTNNGPWLRLYTDAYRNRKLRLLPETLQLRYMWFLCLHKEDKLAGSTPEEIAWDLRLPIDDVSESIKALQDAKLIAKDLSPIGWEERQFISDDSSERVRRHREKKRYGNVTVTPSDSDSDSDSDSETEEEYQVASAKPDAPAGPTSQDTKTQEWEQWAQQWAQTMHKSDNKPIAVYQYYLTELDKCLALYYEGRGGRMTPTRYRNLGRRLSKMEPDAVLLAIEMYCDKHAVSKDERYLIGIARRLNPLSEAEFKRDLDRHRESFQSRGLWDGRPK